MPTTTTSASDSIIARLKHVQEALGVSPDGVLGPETLTALESRLGIKPPARTASLECSRRSLDEIVAFEVTSAKVYEKKYRRPIWPGGRSGVTVGIGYDLGATSKAHIERDWHGRVADAALAELLAVQGVTGAAAKTLASARAHIEIPFAVAAAVFYQTTLPRYARRTRKTYPGVQRLPPDAQGMLLSLTYNRGTDLSGDRRREMAEVQRLIAQCPADCLELIADQFEAMQRLWPALPGLQKRRVREAGIIRAADREYSPQEIVRL